MTADRDFDRQLASWFDEIATRRAPDGLLERSLERVGATRQRPGWLVRDRRDVRMPQRFSTMNLLAAAAVIGVLAVGGALLCSAPAQSGDRRPRPDARCQRQSAPSRPRRRRLDPARRPRRDPAGDRSTRPRSSPTAASSSSGATTPDDVSRASAELYDPATDTFSPTGSLATARGLHTATLLADGRVLIAGGGPASWAIEGAYLASAELYDPKTGTFSPTGSMATPREDHTATLLADGRVLIAGGNDVGDHGVASAELYDPKTGTFSPTGSMTTARGFHTATLLADGRVLIAGGDPAAWTTLARTSPRPRSTTRRPARSARPARWRPGAPTTPPPCSPTVASWSPAATTTAADQPRLGRDVRPEDRHVQPDRLDDRRARLPHRHPARRRPRPRRRRRTADLRQPPLPRLGRALRPEDRHLHRRPARWPTRAPTTPPPCSPTAASS